MTEPLSTEPIAPTIEQLAGAGIYPVKAKDMSKSWTGKREGIGHPRTGLAEKRRAFVQAWMDMPISRYKRMLKKVWKAAENGDAWAIGIVRDMTAGKPAQAVEHTGEVGILPIVAFIPEGVIVEGSAEELPPVNEPEP